ncbi:MAG: MarR family transcriptional regulator [Hespellia sp.]|nr:MarR family transcriptional regulator [Hespellia sp.]
MKQAHKDCNATLGFVIKDLSNILKRKLDHVVFGDTEEFMSGAHGWLICYLHEEGKKRDIYQRDIEQHFNIRRSSVTGLLQKMEKNGLIVRESVENDARLKKIMLTPRAVENHLMITQRIDAFDQILEAGITPEEREIFIRVADKIKHNLESGEDQSE